jgi:hypothetical protein
VDRIGLAQDRYRWRALVKAGMNILVPLTCWEEEDEVGGTCGTNGGEEERV